MTGLFQERRKWPKVINTQSGNSTISVETINLDQLITREAQQDISKQLEPNKIHIASTKETHLSNDTIINVGRNRIYTSSAPISPKYNPEDPQYAAYIGGVAVAVHRELAQHVSIVKRIDNRLIQLTCDAKNHTPKLQY